MSAEEVTFPVEGGKLFSWRAPLPSLLLLLEYLIVLYVAEFLNE
jgi:hypothetical protein